MIHKEVMTEGAFIAGETFFHALNGRMDSKTCQSGEKKKKKPHQKLCTKAEVLYLFVLLILFIYIFIEVKLVYRAVLDSGI